MSDTPNKTSLPGGTGVGADSRLSHPSADDGTKSVSEQELPLPLVEDHESGDRFLIYATDSGLRVDLTVDGDTFWAAQQQMADAFGVTRQNISLHLSNIFREGELDEAAVCKESLRTGRDGKRYTTKLYNLNALISVGYRVGGKLGTAFRLWATDKLIRYLTRGFVVDAKRLKSGGDLDRIAELREVIRDIRAAEANVYAELRRICTLCQDYDPLSPAAREFYTFMQAKLYWATLSRTPAMVRVERADANAPNMGVQTSARQNVVKADTATAKNFLMETELKELNRLTTILLDVFEDQVEIGRLTLMAEATTLLEAQLRQLHRPVLQGGGSVSQASAETHVNAQYRIFDERRRALRAEQTLKELEVLKATEKAMPKGRKPRPPK